MAGNDCRDGRMFYKIPSRILLHDQMSIELPTKPEWL
jgi:hypothetical protein